MALHPYEEEDPYGANNDNHDNLNSVRSNPVKRIRWATRRANPQQGQRKRQSILDRFHRRQASDKTNASGGTDSDGSVPEFSEKPAGGDSKRTLYFNMPLPPSARDEEGQPIAQYPRNKIRTAKYTPLSFVPKNLYYQFHNIANIYFLFIVILSIFSIFGASNPGLSAVPIIVILFLTAVKDAIEDFRRTVLDAELNNSRVHRLIGFQNVNVSLDNISLWRRFKKANTRLVSWIWSSMKKPKKKEGKSYADRALDQARSSTDSRRVSIMSEARASFHSANEDVELTPVGSPRISNERAAQTNTKEDPFAGGTNGHLNVPRNRNSVPIPKRDYGNLIDGTKTAAGNARFARDYWKNIQVGDFVRLYNEEPVPADIVVLATSDPDGACYVETKNLDGETNLKVRQALHCGQKVKRARDCERTEFWIDSEPPHANLYSYSAVVRWLQRNDKDPEAPRMEMAEPISINNLLLRGCSIRNTEWVLGVVVFSGEETKIMINSGITPSKRARISRDLNWNVIYNFIILFFMCLVAAFVEGTYWGKSNTSIDYFEFGSYGSTGALNGFITFWAAVILFQNLVPISLYISLEIIRSVQAFFIYSDTAMYYEKVDYPCTPKTWNISDDLGQIEYIFSDKTGTLTQNVMEFKKATIGGAPYGEAYTEALAGMQKRKGINTDIEGAKAREQIEKDKAQMLRDLRSIHNNPYLDDDELTFIAPDFVTDLRGDGRPGQREANHQFMLALALCHTVITERTPGDPPRIEFKAQSPDEAALVSTARDCGFTVVGRSGNDAIVVNVMGEDIEYTVLNTLEFNSSRKRMSAIIRMPDGRIILFCKGADSVIYSRLKANQQRELRDTTSQHLEMFAREGLRTLCIAQKAIPEEEYQAWNKRHDLAAAAVEDRDDKLEAVADEMERDLTLLGGTAIEDRLQDGVPDAIALLGNAGIKLWVLTGDKVETAINIGFSCNLLNNDMDMIVFQLEEDTLEAAEAFLDKNLQTFGMTGSDEELKAAKKNHQPPAPTHAIVIDGDALKLVLDPKLKQKFLLLCKNCKSVLCCRVSPSQKAAVVQMVKTGLDVITLSIGDGANDVAMIQEADVGVGIAGEEGRQAVMSSDFAIGQFRFLARLTLVHGRWCYRRLGETIANFFYKNIVWTFALFWYQIFDNFDCSYIFDYTYILLYNLAFTSLAVIFQGILDQDVDDKVSLAVPQLYRRGIERKEWTQPKFWLYMLDGLYQSVMCFWMPYLLFSPANFNTEDGHNIDDYKRIGVYIANPAVIVVNVYILLNTYRWDWAMVGITLFSILLIFFWTGVYTSFTASFQFYEAAKECYGQLTFWAQCLFTVIVCLLPRFAIKSYQKIYMPYDVDIVREQVRQGKFDYLKNEDPGKLFVPNKQLSVSSSDDAHEIVNGGLAAIKTNDESNIYTDSTRPLNRTGSGHGQQDSGDTWASMPPPRRPSLDRPRPSFERFRASMDQLRPSIEASRNFTSSSQLMKVESSQSYTRSQ